MMNCVDIKNKLLKQLSNREIDMKTFLYKCALWGMETGCWVEYEYRQLPVPPAEWREYMALPLAKRQKMSEEFFHTLPIKEYLSMCGKIKSANQSDLDWLKEMKRNIEAMGKEEDGILLRKIDAKIAEFSRTVPIEYTNAAEIFGGKIENY